jgi:hypothetical protein
MTATVTKPAPVVPSKAKGDRRRMWIGIAAAVVVVGLLVWALVALVGGGEPRLNENSVVLTKFVRSRDFEQLPYEKQRQFYKVLDDREDEIDQLFAGKRLSESEYRAALEAGWLGKHINRVEKYYALPPGKARDDYIDKLLDKKEKKKDASKSGGNIKADETAAEMKVEAWPPAVREQWKTFHTNYSREKKAREAAATQPGKKQP